MRLQKLAIIGVILTMGCSDEINYSQPHEYIRAVGFDQNYQVMFAFKHFNYSKHGQIEHTLNINCRYAGQTLGCNERTTFKVIQQLNTPLDVIHPSSNIPNLPPPAFGKFPYPPMQHLDAANTIFNFPSLTDTLVTNSRRVSAAANDSNAIESVMQGTLKKMRTRLDEQGLASYHLLVGENEVELNPLIGSKMKLVHTGNIFCCNCGKKTKKSYSQGHCFVCMKKLASCDMCIMKPETCHFAEGTCREPEWGEANCFVPHYVYLSNTSGLKVGITRHTQLPTRWIDQGATQGLPILKVSSRQLSGLIEVELAKMIADKTNWRAMLKGNAEPLPLKQHAEELLPQIEQHIHSLAMAHGEYAIERLNEEIVAINYPVSEFPTKIASHNFDKDPVVSGTLLGIKGQYLIFDTGVINLRKFTAYEVSFEAE